MKNLRSALRGAIGATAILAALAPAAFAVTPEAAPIVALNAGLISAMKAGSAHASFISRYDALKPVVMAAVDSKTIVKNSSGFYWSSFPAGQQQKLIQLFEQFTIASYASSFSSYDGQKLVVLPTERTVGDKKVVETQIVQNDNSTPTEIDYVMADGPNGWQVTDVLLNGTISKVAIQSSDFASEISQGNASQLIAALEQKVSTLSGGAITD